MAQILDKQGLQHYANKMCNADNRKVGSRNLPTALNEIDIAIDGFKTLFETEYRTPVNMELENNENVFSIGTGINIDKKDDVENSFTDVEIKGTTLVNIYGKGFSDVANIGNGSGEIVDDGYYKLVANGSFRNAFLQKGKFPMKPSTVYTVIMFVRKETLVGSKHFMLSDGTSDSPFQDSSIDLNGIGTYTKKVITLSDFDSTDFCFRGYILPQATSGELEFKVMLLEGDWTNKPIPQYFEGMKSVGEKEDGNHKISISSTGKNLILDSEFKNQNNEWVQYRGEVVQGYLNNTGYRIKYSGTGDYYDVLSQVLYDCNANQNKILPSTWYTLSFYAKGNTMRTHIYPSLIDANVKGIVNGVETTLSGDGHYTCNLTNKWQKITYTFKTKSQIAYRDIGHRLLFRALPNSDCVISCVMLEQGKIATEYKSQQVDKKEISLNEPLRGLPNGVRDTIEKINGEWKIIRRCKQTILTGDNLTEFVVGAEGTTSSIGQDVNRLNFILNDVKYKTNSTPFICDKFSYVNFHSTPNGSTERNIEAISFHSGNSKELNVHLLKTKLSEQTSAGAKSWLNSNPVTVIYELENYITEDISPITLQCWKNGTISIDEVLPVETTHTVALNKSAQIQKNIEELTLLRNRVEALEKQYNNSTLNQAYELELLRLDMELDNIV